MNSERRASGNGTASAREIWTFEFDGGLVLLDDSSSRVFVYSGDTRPLWAAVEAGLTREEISGEVAHLSVKERRAIDLVLDQWQHAGLLASASTAAVSMPEPPRASSAGSTDSMHWRASVGPLHVAFDASAPEIARQLKFMLGTIEEEAQPDLRISVDTLADGSFTAHAGERELVHATTDGLLRGAIFQACLDTLYGQPAWQTLTHGAAVATEGRAIALPAPSGSGKTTLTAWLIARGFDYLADDLVAILRDGRIAPWPLPISVKAGSVPVLSDNYPGLAGSASFDAYGKTVRLIDPPQSSWSQPPMPLHAIVFPQYDPLGDGVLRPLRPLHALTRLVNDRVWIGYPITPARLEEFLAWLGDTPTFSIDYADLDAAEAAIRGLCAAP